MGLCLIAFNWLDPIWIWNVLKVVIGLGMVIFVHELGHFLVAKLCGVKCEKFYLGFDIGGLKLWKFRRGETEYGIGILPLGGYVKMLGQDDNPARAAEERERSQLKTEGGTPAAASAPPQLDPRSYMAKSVPQRMAIISAGVIMNVIFAFLMAAAAYTIGVRDNVCGASAVLPGEPAWRADLQPGDRIVGIEGYGDAPLRFRDLMGAVAFGNIEKGVDFKVQREGVAEPFWVNVKPDLTAGRLLPMIGIMSPRTTKLEQNPIVYGGTPAAQAGFKEGDVITAIDDVPVKTYADYEAQLTKHADHPLKFTVARPVAGSKPEENETTIQQIEVAPRPRRLPGLVMTMGKITAIQNGSPAEKADIRPGDRIVTVDGQPVADPLLLPELLSRRAAGEIVAVTVERETAPGKSEKLDKQVTIRERPWFDESAAPKSPVSVPSMGLAYQVNSIIQSIPENSPAAQAKVVQGDKPAAVSQLAVGDQILQVEFVAPKVSPEEQKLREKDESQMWVGVTDKPIELQGENANWPYFAYILQQLPAGTQIKVSLSNGRTATFDTTTSEDLFYHDRGLITSADLTVARARTVGEALAMGKRETMGAVLQVYSFLRRVGTQISPFALGGPVSIARAAGNEASKGVPELLIFLTMLSANLAVINFLPIPLLDGGHMVFLILEGIFRRPVSEKVVVAFHYVGFVFIISLMLFVLGLDVGIIPRY